MDMDSYHISVLPNETIHLLNIKPDGLYIDGTVGGGGHSSIIASQLTTGKLLCIDKDSEALAFASERMKAFNNVTFAKGDFKNMADIAVKQGFSSVDGILLDLGVSSHQLDAAERGFSYRADAPLDMRMSGEGVSAYDVVNGYDRETLAKVIFSYGEEKFAYRIADAIVGIREQSPIKTTTELAEIIKNAIPAATRRSGGHPAKRTFQAIRMEVNAELDALERFLESALPLLSVGGVMAIITFHSLEDRMVKVKFKEWATGCTCPPNFPVCVCGNTPKVKIATKKPITADSTELEQNNRSRSAKLRGIIRL